MRGWGEGDHLVVDSQHPRGQPCRATGFEDGAEPRQRDADVAPGGHGVEIRPHQFADALATQRSGKDEQLEQRADPPAS